MEYIDILAVQAWLHCHIDESQRSKIKVRVNQHKKFAKTIDPIEGNKYYVLCSVKKSLVAKSRHKTHVIVVEKIPDAIPADKLLEYIAEMMERAMLPTLLPMRHDTSIHKHYKLSADTLNAFGAMNATEIAPKVLADACEAMLDRINVHLNTRLRFLDSWVEYILNTAFKMAPCIRNRVLFVARCFSLNDGNVYTFLFMGIMVAAHHQMGASMEDYTGLLALWRGIIATKDIIKSVVTGSTRVTAMLPMVKTPIYIGSGVLLTAVGSLFATYGFTVDEAHLTLLLDLWHHYPKLYMYLNFVVGRAALWTNVVRALWESRHPLDIGMIAMYFGYQHAGALLHYFLQTRAAWIDPVARAINPSTLIPALTQHYTAGSGSFSAMDLLEPTIAASTPIAIAASVLGNPTIAEDSAGDYLTAVCALSSKWTHKLTEFSYILPDALRPAMLEFCTQYDTYLNMTSEVREMLTPSGNETTNVAFVESALYHFSSQKVSEFWNFWMPEITNGQRMAKISEYFKGSIPVAYKGIERAPGLSMAIWNYMAAKKEPITNTFVYNYIHGGLFLENEDLRAQWFHAHSIEDDFERAIYVGTLLQVRDWIPVPSMLDLRYWRGSTAKYHALPMEEPIMEASRRKVRLALARLMSVRGPRTRFPSYMSAAAKLSLKALRREAMVQGAGEILTPWLTRNIPGLSQLEMNSETDSAMKLGRHVRKLPKMVVTGQAMADHALNMVAQTAITKGVNLALGYVQDKAVAAISGDGDTGVFLDANSTEIYVMKGGLKGPALDRLLVQVRYIPVALPSGADGILAITNQEHVTLKLMNASGFHTILAPKNYALYNYYADEIPTDHEGPVLLISATHDQLDLHAISEFVNKADDVHFKYADIHLDPPSQFSRVALSYVTAGTTPEYVEMQAAKMNEEQTRDLIWALNEQSNDGAFETAKHVFQKLKVIHHNCPFSLTYLHSKLASRSLLPQMHYLRKEVERLFQATDATGNLDFNARLRAWSVNPKNALNKTYFVAFSDIKSTDYVTAHWLELHDHAPPETNGTFYFRDVLLPAPTNIDALMGYIKKNVQAIQSTGRLDLLPVLATVYHFQPKRAYDWENALATNYLYAPERWPLRDMIQEDITGAQEIWGCPDVFQVSRQLEKQLYTCFRSPQISRKAKEIRAEDIYRLYRHITKKIVDGYLTAEKAKTAFNTGSKRIIMGQLSMFVKYPEGVRGTAVPYKQAHCYAY